MPRKKTPQKQLQIQPSSNRAVVTSWSIPMAKLVQQLPQRDAIVMSSFLEQQHTLKPASIVPET